MIPFWLFDEIADAIADNAELDASATAWGRLLDGAEEIDTANGVPFTRAEARLDLKRYRELRAAGVRGDAWTQQRTDFWHPTVERPAEDETYYVRPARAAAISGLSTSRLSALRRRGRIRSIGMTPAEYKRAREQAGWGDATGWGPGVWYLREDVEALAREKWRAA